MQTPGKKELRLIIESHMNDSTSPQWYSHTLIDWKNEPRDKCMERRKKSCDLFFFFSFIKIDVQCEWV